jgi:hypothetical protein
MAPDSSATGLDLARLSFDPKTGVLEVLNADGSEVLSKHTASELTNGPARTLFEQLPDNLTVLVAQAAHRQQRAREHQARLAALRVKAERRVEDARRHRSAPPPVMAAPVAPLGAARERREQRSASRTSRGSPDDDGESSEADPPLGGFRLNFVDRAPALWRLRAVRCRLLELVEGAER